MTYPRCVFLPLFALTACFGDELPLESGTDGTATDDMTGATSVSTTSNPTTTSATNTSSNDSSADGSTTTASSGDTQTSDCGNGEMDADEQCDDGPGNNGPGKACNAECQLNVCGDGDKGPGEACDDGDADDALCNVECIPSACGNGTLEPYEMCDDGNTDDGDGCEANCSFAGCHDGAYAEGETCLVAQPGITLDDNPHGVAVAELTGDEHLDVAIVNRFGDTFEVLAGDGLGNFELLETYAACQTPRTIALGDLDNDGALDIAIACETNPGLLALFANDGSGGFTTMGSLEGGNNAWGVTIADFDGDGNADVAGSYRATDNAIVWPGDGNFSFGTEVTVASGDGYTVLAFNVIGDARIDLFVGNFDSDSFTVAENNSSVGSIAFQPPASTAACDGPTFAGIGHMDDDGYMDVVLPCYYDAGAHVYQGGGGGLLNVDTPALIANPDEAIFFDADGDEHLDIAAVSVGNVGVTVGHNDGTNHFAAEDMIILGHATELARIASGDFDGNGYDDLVGGHGLGANSRLWVFLNFP